MAAHIAIIDILLSLSFFYIFIYIFIFKRRYKQQTTAYYLLIFSQVYADLNR